MSISTAEKKRLVKKLYFRNSFSSILLEENFTRSWISANDLSEQKTALSFTMLSLEMSFSIPLVVLKNIKFLSEGYFFNSFSTVEYGLLVTNRFSFCSIP